MKKIDPEHDDGTSDATPGGKAELRRPGELLFALVMVAASLLLFLNAYEIENPFGSNGLSSPRAIPMATTFVMGISAVIIILQTVRLPLDRTETIAKDILPIIVLIFAGMLIAYGILLQPFGFLPISALFLIISIKLLSKRSWVWTFGISIGCMIAIWLIFRIIFSVLMPPGIVPEAEFIQFFRNLSQGMGAS